MLISAFQDNVQSRTVDSQFGASEYKQRLSVKAL